MDPLAVLREFTAAGRLGEVTVTSGRVLFGSDFDFDAAAPTGYVSSTRSGAAAAQQLRYTAGALAFFAAAANFAAGGTAAYMRAARDAGVQTVAVLDQKPLAAYLKGEVDTTPGVVPLPVADLPSVGLEDGAAAKKARTAEEQPAPATSAAEAADATVAAARAAEAPWSLRDRNAPLMAGVKDFSFAVVKAQTATAAAAAAFEAARKAEAKQAAVAAAAAPRSRPSAAAVAMAALPSRRFERTDAPGAARAALDDMGLGGDEAWAGGVQAYGDVLGGGGEGPPSDRPPAAPVAASFADPDPAGTAQAKVERAAAAAAAKAAAAAAARRPAAAPKPTTTAAAAGAKPGTAPPSSSASIPIIIVPAAATARINLLNAGPFLEEGRFVPAEAARAAGAKKPADGRLTITRSIGRGGPGGRPPVPYIITDRAPPPNHRDWRRVVAVFVGGAAWQFKGWSFVDPATGAKVGEGDTVALFSRLAGFHVAFADEAVPAAVKDWAVTRLALHRTERHRDRSTAERVWRAIDDFLGPRGSTLAY